MFGFVDIDELFAFGPYRVAVIAYSMFLRLWYFLAIGIMIGAAFNAFVPAEKIKSMIHKADNFMAILISALLGAVSPLGSYAVIPFFTTFLSMGIPLATVMAFLTASPMINPYIFYITWQLLGLEMALARTFSAVIVATMTGLIFRYVARYAPFQNHAGDFLSAPSLENASACQSKSPGAMVEHGKEPPLWMNGRRLIRLSKKFAIQCLKMIKHPAKWFAFSIILAAIVDVYVPTDWVVRSLGGHSYSLLLAAGMAIPFYVCGGGAVPLVWGLMRSGMDQGAALTFFIVGPVTNIAPMATIIALLGYRPLAVYISVALVSALVLGYLYHFL